MRSALFAALLVTAGGALAQQPSPSRDELVAQGEAALARLDPAAAQLAFDRAGSLAHSAGAELGLVRSYMQAGEYRRALAFVAHTAGAHLDEPAGAGLQAWLLYAGGQRQPANRYLTEALERKGDNLVLREVRRQLDSNAPMAQGVLLTPPARFAPYGPSARGVVTGTGWLFDDGRSALVALSALQGSSYAWIRNGMGALARGTLTRRDSRLGVAQLRLEKPLSLPTPTGAAPRDPFAGAVAYAVTYVQGSANAAWPVLSAGFFGGVAEGSRYQRLDLDTSNSRPSGPVFDAAGRLAGLALGREAGGGFVPVSRLATFAGSLPAAEAQASVGSTPADEIYERALYSAVQVIAPR